MRPLLDDGSGSADRATRDYRLDLKKSASGAISLSILGGKLTTYRKLAEQAIDKLGTVFDFRKLAWTLTASLPGGNMPGANIDAFIESTARKFPWLPDSLLRRYATSYGTYVELLMDGAMCLNDLGILLGPDLYEREVQYLVTNEWARTAEDILWRRTKLGLNIDKAGAVQLQRWLDLNIPELGLIRPQ